MRVSCALLVSIKSTADVVAVPPPTKHWLARARRVHTPHAPVALVPVKTHSTPDNSRPWYTFKSHAIDERWHDSREQSRAISVPSRRLRSNSASQETSTRTHKTGSCAPRSLCLWAP